MSEKKESQPSAGRLFKFLNERFNLGSKTLGETSLAGAPANAPVGIIEVATPEPTMMASGPLTPETPLPQAAKTVTPPTAELPDWLQGGEEEAAVETPAPMPEAAAPDVLQYLEEAEAKLAAGRSPFPAPEASAPLPVAEVPAAPSVELPAALTGAVAKTEKNPEQLATEQFEESLLAADNALGWLRAGESLDETQLRAAKAAAATANGLIRNLPERYLKVLLASRRLGENRNYNRLDFQKDMLAAIRVFSQTKKG